MLKDLIIKASPIVLVMLFCIYFILKLIALHACKVRKRNRPNALLKSMLPVPKQFIKNMTNNRLGNYYKRSNKINYRFYVIIFAVLTVYILMTSI